MIATWHRPLVWFAGVMVVLTLVSTIGYLASDRMLVGVPIWAKPLKFSISFAVYAITLAWMVSQLRDGRWRRVGRRAGTTLVVAATLEMTAIVMQVVRGQQSHFNNSTPFDSAVFATMGGLVAVIYSAMIVIAVVVVRESSIADRAVAWAVRLGLFLSVAGLSVGFLMLRPTAAQSAQGDDAAIQGAHSVGVADGGPSIPLLGWSTTGGDLRIPHFVGMHALQVLPLLAIALAALPAVSRLDERARTRLVVLGAIGYGGVFGVTLWQALRGQPLTSPDGLTIAAIAGLVALVAAGVVGTTRAARRPVPVAA